MDAAVTTDDADDAPRTPHPDETAPTGPSGRAPAGVTLRGDELPWRPVSPALAPVRLITLAACLLPVLVGLVVLAELVTPWVWVAVAVVVVAGAWVAWVITRQVSAISWLELDDELVVRKGRIFRSLVAIPYGRLQYVDISSGPLMRWKGIASCELHTASPSSGGTLPGLPTEEAEALRARLADRAEAQRAGL